MKINVSIKEFKKKWYPAHRGEDMYTDGKLQGEIIHEDDNYIVIKLWRK